MLTRFRTFFTLAMLVAFASLCGSAPAQEMNEVPGQPMHATGEIEYFELGKHGAIEVDWLFNSIRIVMFEGWLPIVEPFEKRGSTILWDWGEMQWEKNGKIRYIDWYFGEFYENEARLVEPMLRVPQKPLKKNLP